MIFEKLREINYLLNKRRKYNKVRNNIHPIRFFYLLRDDIFESKDRTKFFDFILPIVPVVDASNAYDKFIEYFKHGNLLELFNTDFLHGLSLYVDDMRVLKNICNEFVIYHERLKSSVMEQDNNKLLAIITYKNLFPKDFGNLQVGTGYVHTLFSQKKYFGKNEIIRLQEEINKLQAENIKINSELCDDLDELNALFFTINGEIKVNGKEEEEYGSRKEFVKEILNSNDIAIHNSYRWNSINIVNEKKAMEQNSDYVKRKLLITQKSNREVEKNNQKIEILKRNIEKLEHAHLKDIISRDNEEEIFAVSYINVINERKEFAEIKRSPYFDLIKFLIRNGYIDETYPDYMTYFYANSITANDRIFLRSITDKNAKQFDYKLDNADLVISRIRLVDFKEQEILNFNLLEKLLSDREKYKSQLQNFLYTIRNVEPIEFVAQFLERNILRRNFIKEFNDSWAGACYWVLTSDKLTKEDKRQYVGDTLCICSEKTIKNNDIHNTIKNFIESDFEFLSIKDVDASQIENGLQLLQVKFNSINFETANKRFLQYVYDNDMYDINIQLIRKILKYFYGVAEHQNVLNKNLSLILSKEDEQLCRYIKKNINLYIEKLLASTKETNDTQEIVIYVLNSEHIEETNKKAYITSTKTKISYLNKIDELKLWNDILDQDKTEKNVENLCDYYYLSDNGMDDRLIKYINSFDEGPTFNAINLDETYGELSEEDLLNDIVKCNSIKNENYEVMVCSFEKIFVVFKETEVLPEKMDILIQRGILEMNSDNLQIMRKNYPQQNEIFIQKNIKDYVDIMNNSIFSSSELIQLLEKEIDEELKIKLLKFETNPISIRNKNYSPNIQDYIVENLYSNEDFEYLLQWYPQNRPKLRNLILDIAIKCIGDVQESNFLLHTGMFKDVMQSEQITVADKKILLAKQIELGIKKSLVNTTFEQLGLREYQQLLEGKHSQIQATESNKNLLIALLKRKWISSYEEGEEDSEYFQVYGKSDDKKGNRRKIVV